MELNKKCCNKCKIEKDIAEFSKYKDSKDGLNYRCRQCCKQYYDKNREIIIAKGVEYGRNNRDKRRIADKRYRQSNKGKGSKAINSRKHRALKRSALHPNHNLKIEKVLQHLASRLKDKLGIEFDIDHIYPLSQGGPHHHGNLQVIPASLNNRKSNSLEYKHELLIHWTELPAHILNWKNVIQLTIHA